MKVRLRTVLVVAGVAAFCSLLSLDRLVLVHAISSSGPDSSEFGGAYASYYLADTSDVGGATTTGIPIYLNGSNPPTSNVQINFWCDGRPQAVNVTSPVAGQASPWQMCAKNSGEASGSFSVPPDKFTYDADSKRFKIILRFALVGADRRGFRLSLPGGGYIGYSSTDNTDRFAIVNQNRCGQTVYATGASASCNFYTYSLPFAAPCTRDDEDAKITIYDADNLTGANSSQQYNRQFSGRVEDIDTGEVRLYLDTTSPAMQGNGNAVDFVFRSIKGHRYRLILDNVYTNNVLQFKLPYDSINTLTSCPKNDLLPRAVIATASLTYGSEITPSEIIYNRGDTAPFSSDYDAYQFVVPAGKSVNFGSQFTTTTNGYTYTTVDYGASGDACKDWLRPTFGAANIQCDKVTTSGSQAFPGGVQTDIGDTTAIRANDYSIGDLVCRLVAVRSFNGDNETTSRRRISLPVCVKILKKPLVQIWGNDLRVGSASAVTANMVAKITGSSSVMTGKTYGSWVEYGQLAPGAVLSMASGSAFAPGSVTAEAGWNKLTFANKSGVYGSFGEKAAMGVQPNIKQYFINATISGITKDVVIGDATVNSYRPNTVIIASGTVTINSSVNAPNGNVSDIDSLEQMVIIANNINITQNVQRVDAWLVASEGTINTCSDAPVVLIASTCDKELTITGPVVAKTLLLRRTYGKTPAPAETVNLRSDAYLWAYRQSVKQGAWVTRNTKELPPRY
ncbi:MAG: hypothetical protein WAQ25_01000 [Candidatus Saccharimonas sp.]